MAKDESILKVRIVGTEKLTDYKREILATEKKLKDMKEATKGNIGAQKAAAKQLSVLETKLKILGSEYRKIQKTLDASVVAQNKAKEATRKAKEETKKAATVEKNAAKAKIALTKEAKRVRKSSLENANAFIRLQKQTKNAELRFKRLSAQYGATDEKTKKALSTFKKLDSRLKSITKSARDVNKEVKKTGTFSGSMAKGFSKAAISLGAATLGAAALFRVMKSGLKVVSDFDESVANLAKTTNLSKEAARELAQEILKIDTRTSVTALLELATAGGRLGLVGRELIDFTRETDKAFVALSDSLDGSAEDIGLTLGKLAANFGIEKKFGIGESINKVGSALNELGANSKATEGFIVDFTKRLSGVGAQAGISITDIQALGALFDETGQSVEISATTFNKLLPAIGKDVAKFAKIAGVDIEEFSRITKEDAFEALKLVAIGAKSTSGGLQGLADTMQNYGIDAARAASIVTVLSNNTDRLGELQEIANTAFEEGTSLSKEFAIKNETLAAETEKLKNQWDEFIISLDGTDSAIGNLSKSFIGFLSDSLKGIQNLDLIWRSLFNDVNELGGDAIDRLLDGGWVTEFGENITEVTDRFDDIPFDRFTNDFQNVQKEWIATLGEDREDAIALFEGYLKNRKKQEEEAVKGREETLKKQKKLEEQAAKDKIVADNKEAENEAEKLSIFEKQQIEAAKKLSFEKQQVLQDELDKQQFIDDIEIDDIEEQNDKKVETLEEFLARVEQIEINAALKKNSREIEQREKEDKEAEEALEKVRDRFERQGKLAEQLGDKIGIVFTGVVTDNKKLTEEGLRQLSSFLISTVEKSAIAAIVKNQLTALSTVNPIAIAKALASIVLIKGVSTVAKGAISQAEQGAIVPKANRGGVIQGASHANGGVPVMVNGRQAIEAEGGEPIITKGVTRSPADMGILSAINVKHGGVPLVAQSGGFVPSAPTSSGGGFNSADFSRELAEQIAQTMPAPVLVADDVNDVNDDQRRLDVESQF